MSNVMIERLEHLLLQGHDSPLLRFGLANAYTEEKKFTEAIKHLRAALEQDPDYSAAWKLYGQALTHDQQIDAAIAAYEKGILVAEKHGDKQTAKEMQVFLKRLKK